MGIKINTQGNWLEIDWDGESVDINEAKYCCPKDWVDFWGRNNWDCVEIEIEGYRTFPLSYIAAQGMYHVEQVNGTQPTSNEDLYNKIKTAMING